MFTVKNIKNHFRDFLFYLDDKGIVPIKKITAKYHAFLWYLAEKGITPNQVTIGRTLMFLIVIIFWMLSREYEYHYILPLLVIISIPIWILDMVDGDLARITEQMTDVGKWLDPLADKIKFYLAMLAFSNDLHFFDYILILFMFSLDLSSTLIRKNQDAKNIGSNDFGKFKLCFQVVSIISFAFYIFLEQIRFYDLASDIYDIAIFSLISAIILAIISVWQRIKKENESIF